MEEGGEGEGVASEEGERTSCEVLPGEEAEVRRHTAPYIYQPTPLHISP